MFKITHIGWEDLNALTGLARSNKIFSNKTFSRVHCQYENEFCIEQSKRLFESAMSNELSPGEQRYKLLYISVHHSKFYIVQRLMTKNLDWVWCSVIRFSGDKEWQFAWKASVDPQLTALRGDILSAMSCSKEEKHLKSLLSRIHHPDIVQYPLHTAKMMEAMSHFPSSRSLAKKFLLSNWELLSKQYDVQRIIYFPC